MSIKTSLLHFACTSAMLFGTALVVAPQGGSAATLVHRYSFNTDTVDGYTVDNGDGTHMLVVSNVTDLVGGTAWDGTLPGYGTFTNIVDGTPNIPDGTVAKGGVMLDPSISEYVQFPAGIISNYTAITVDAWAVITNTGGFLWAFGDTRASDGFGGNAVWFNVFDARLTITDTMPSWGGEQNAFVPRLGNAGYMHVSCVVDPPNHRLTVYTNGVLAGINTGETRSLTNVYSIYNYIAKSVFSGDALASITIDEFRIFDGALNGMEIAGYDVAGPDSVTSNIGTLTNVLVSAPYAQLVQGGHETVAVAGQSTLFVDPAGNPKPINIDNNLCTFSSSDNSILKVNTNGLVTAVQPGTASIIAAFGSVSNSISISVFAEPVTLVHRWSFNNTDDGMGNYTAMIADSVGGTSWDGTLPNGGSFTNGQLFLSGGILQYVNLPTNIFSGMTNVTFDVWTTFPAALPWNAWFFGFGDSQGGTGGNYFFVQPQSGSFCMGGGFPGWQFDSQRASAGTDWSGQTLHITCVASTGGGFLTLYTNGVLAATFSNLTYPMSSIVDNYSWINQSLYSGDPHVDNTIDEFRIYSGAMSAQQVAANDAAGPDALGVIPPTLAVTVSGGNVILSWPTSYTGYTLMTETSLSAGGWSAAGSAVVSGANYQVTLPATNSVQFFRLSK